ncbi:hypothetical protein [Paenibacillus xylanexedens]|uniref:hypothetical protein n=1 Tax=Paenibacillus xylanexedens TaxID=528191 RepID=UPI000F528C87|nr:hypothetical protein [Paenibacillus xylanexedens]RPK20107.1 hypothetical protein EDO6_06646 [Paenibacillus xylanexedens]
MQATANMIKKPTATKRIGERAELVIYSKDYKVKERKQGNHLIVGMRYNGKPSGAHLEYKVKRGVNENGLMYLLFLGVKHYLNEFTSVT